MKKETTKKGVIKMGCTTNIPFSQRQVEKS